MTNFELKCCNPPPDDSSVAFGGIWFLVFELFLLPPFHPVFRLFALFVCWWSRVRCVRFEGERV